VSEQLPDGIREIAAGQIERLGDLVAGLSDADLVAAFTPIALEGDAPGDVPRETLVARMFRARRADESQRARLRVEAPSVEKKTKRCTPAPGRSSRPNFKPPN